MAGDADVRVTRNFERNLEEIQQFLERGKSAAAFDDVLTLLFDEVVPKLASFPRLGYDLMARKPRTVEAFAQITLLRRRLGDSMSVREYIAGDYLLLYAVIDNQVCLLSIRHHRQLSFDLRGHL